jgi:hypothetical protein
MASKRALPSDAPADQPAKKRRIALEQASVICMRELIKASTRDGDLTEEKKLAFQNVGVLLAQVNQRLEKSNMQVDFGDTHGELKELTPRLRNHLRPFLHKVAENVKGEEAEQFEEQDMDCLPIVTDGWDFGASANELISCCEPDVEVSMNGALGKACTIATNGLPTQYMLRSRVRELINHYFVYNQAVPSAKKRKSVAEKIQESGYPGSSVVAWCCAAVWKMFVMLLLALPIVLKQFNEYIQSLMALLSIPFKLVVKYTFLLAWKAVDGILPDNSPLLSALRLFISAFVSDKLSDVLGMVVMVLRLRVLLCLAHANPTVMGVILHPLVYLAELMADWDPEGRIFGCKCGLDDPRDSSVLAFIPVRLTTVVFDALELFDDNEYAVSVVSFIIVFKPVSIFIVNLLFSLGIANALQSVKVNAEEVAKPKMFWMSLALAKKLREHHDWNAAPTSPGPPDSLLNTPEKSSPVAPPPVPEWKEDGTWSLFSGTS